MYFILDLTFVHTYILGGGGGGGGALLIWGLLLTKSEVLYVYNIHINWSFLLACCFFLFLFLLYVCKIYVAH